MSGKNRLLTRFVSQTVEASKEVALAVRRPGLVATLQSMPLR